MPTPARQAAFEAIESERDHQDRKWGTIHDHPHEVGAWLTIMRKLLADAEAAYFAPDGHVGALEKIRDVSAVGVACMEQHGAPMRSFN